MAKGPSLKELRLMVRSAPQRISLELLVCSSYARFVELIEQALDHIAITLARNPELKQKHSEDQLTIDLVSGLNFMGFSARHETKVGGHCDVVIEGRDDYLWLGEAKIYTSYSWLFKGFRQLDTRYATAHPNQDAGGFLIYCFQERVDKIMGKWQEKAGRAGLSFQSCPNNPLARISKHTHRRTGRQFRVRHMPFSLYWNPQDQ
jgi:hypothetical protein